MCVCVRVCVCVCVRARVCVCVNKMVDVRVVLNLLARQWKLIITKTLTENFCIII